MILQICSEKQIRNETGGSMRSRRKLKWIVYVVVALMVVSTVAPLVYAIASAVGERTPANVNTNVTSTESKPADSQESTGPVLAEKELD